MFHLYFYSSEGILSNLNEENNKTTTLLLGKYVSYIKYHNWAHILLLLTFFLLYFQHNKTEQHPINNNKTSTKKVNPEQSNNSIKKNSGKNTKAATIKHKRN